MVKLHLISVLTSGYDCPFGNFSDDFLKIDNEATIPFFHFVFVLDIFDENKNSKSDCCTQKPTLSFCHHTLPNGS